MSYKKRGAILIIINLILSTIAVVFLIALTEVEMVNAALPSNPRLYQITTDDTNLRWIWDGKTWVSQSSDNFKLIVERSKLQSPPSPSAVPSPAGGRIPYAETQQEWFGFQSYGLGHIAQGLVWSLFVVGAIQLLGRMFGFDENAVNAASAAAFSGIMAGKLTLGAGHYLAPETFAAYGTGIGIGVGIIVALVVFELMYKEESKKIVSFSCNPWEAPTGGKNCEKCNSELYPCTEYRCKSLGQACQLLNPGTGEEKCAWVNPKDVNSPIMQPNKNELTKDHVYNPNNAIRPPDRGVKIVYNKATDGCIKAFTPLSFGIIVNEPSQCKIDYNRTIKFDDMAFYFGNSNIYKYNHTQTLSLPSPAHINAQTPEIKNDGTYNLYVRCKDANGNENTDLFVFSFCVEKGPDVTAPKIEATSIANNMPFQYGLNETSIEVYVNEPSDCKFSRVDMDYKDMENSMDCNSRVLEMNSLMLYKCSSTLKGLIDRQDNIFYFKCKDQPWLKNTAQENDRNTNTESYKFSLKGTQPLTITEVKPNGTIRGAGITSAVFLEIETDNGYNFGDSWCSYSLTQNEKDFIRFFETGTNKHVQRLDLPAGTYKYYLQCVDLGGNAVKSNTSFSLEVDKSQPIVVRAYKDGSNLKIITDEKSTCSYNNNQERACNFRIEEGTNMPYVNSTEHSTSWETGKNFYIKCADTAGNQPLPTACSIIVKMRD